MKRQVDLTIVPAYGCNFRCDFCYLSATQLGDTTTHLSPIKLMERLQDITAYANIGSVELSGGEIGLFSDDYIRRLVSLIGCFYKGPVTISTNLSVLRESFLDAKINLIVGYDFYGGDQSDAVLQNLRSSPVDINVRLTVTPRLIKHNPDDIVATLNSIPRIKNVVVTQCMSSASNDVAVTDAEYEEFVFELHASGEDRTFTITTDQLTRGRPRLFVEPSGLFSIMDVDDQNRMVHKPCGSFKTFARLIDNN